jgi:DNA-binding transcriptional regulator YiaG
MTEAAPLPPDAAFVQRVRRKLRLTQREFAAAYGIGYKRLRDLEQGRYRADPVLVSFVRCIEAFPGEVRGLLKAANPPALTWREARALKA